MAQKFAFAYVESLKKTGVPVEFELYKGCFHGFDQMCPKAEVSKKAVAFIKNAYKYAVEHYFAEQNTGQATDE